MLLSGPFRKEMSAGFRLTTNNRMELMAVCVALEALKFAGSDVVVYSDSKYVVDAVTKGWVFGWEKKGFAGKKNPDLWRRFLGEPDGRGGGQRARSAGRYGLRGGAAGGVSAAAAVNRRPTISRRATVFLSKTFGVAGKSLI